MGKSHFNLIFHAFVTFNDFLRLFCAKMKKVCYHHGDRAYCFAARTPHCGTFFRLSLFLATPQRKVTHPKMMSKISFSNVIGLDLVDQCFVGQIQSISHPKDGNSSRLLA